MHRLALSVLSLTLVASLACTSESAVPTPVAASETGSSEPAAAAADVEAAPKIACAEAVYNFGAVSPTDKIEHVFTIKNEGTAELKIERVQKT